MCKLMEKLLPGVRCGCLATGAMVCRWVLRKHSFLSEIGAAGIENTGLTKYQYLKRSKVTFLYFYYKNFF